MLVGDVVRELNGKALPPRRGLFEVLTAEFVMPGDELTLGLTRTLERHMEDATRERAVEIIPPDSPRMLGRTKIDYAARWQAYKLNPISRGFGRQDYALGGGAGLVL